MVNRVLFQAILDLKTDDRFKHMDFYCIGPLIPKDKIDKTNDRSALQKQISDWLDQKPEKSVVYLSFGSVAIPGEDRVVEAGKALLAMGKPFIFSLKETLHSFLPAELQQGIASQFQDRETTGLIIPWAPQKVTNNALYSASNVVRSSFHKTDDYCELQMPT